MMSFFFQAEEGIRDRNVTGVQTCALPIWKVDDEVTACVEQTGDQGDRFPNGRAPGLRSEFPTVYTPLRRATEDIEPGEDDGRVGLPCPSLPVWTAPRPACPYLGRSLNGGPLTWPAESVTGVTPEVRLLGDLTPKSWGGARGDHREKDHRKRSGAVHPSGHRPVRGRPKAPRAARA